MRSRSVILKRLLLCSVVTIACLITTRSSAQVNRRALKEKLEKLYRLVHESKDYDGALTWAKQILKSPNIPSREKWEVSTIVELISNYSDFKRKPLELYFNASFNYAVRNDPRKLSQEGHINYWTYWQERRERNLVELVHHYPTCKLAGFALFLLAQNYRDQMQSAVPQRDVDVAEELAVDAYTQIIEKYPEAMFPISDYFGGFKKGRKIAPMALYSLAKMYMSGVDPKPEKAVITLRDILKRYPRAKNGRGTNYAILAYLKLLNIYNGHMSYSHQNFDKYEDIGKARRICNLLLTKYKNQKYDTGESFGEIHPDVLLALGELEKDVEKALKFYMKIFTEYPGSLGGVDDSHNIYTYSSFALDRIVEKAWDYTYSVEILSKIEKSKVSRLAKGLALMKIGLVHERNGNFGNALIAYRRALKRYGKVLISEYEGTIGENAESRIAGLQIKVEYVQDRWREQ